MANAQEIIFESRKKIVEKIIENIERGDLIFTKNWDSQIMTPKNPVSQLNYLGSNKIRLIAAAVEKEYKDPRWVTFKQAESNNWKIKKGEKGTLCEKWIFTKKETEIDENGNKVEKEVKLDKPIANYFHVFNAEQIENIPKLEIKNFTKDETNEIVQNFINSSECKVKEIAQDKAYYNPEKDEIVLPLRESFSSNQDFLKTTFHEMIHSTGHKDRLNRDLTGEYGSESYAKEELVAELGSVFLQSRLGIKLEGNHIDNHSAYLKGWLKVLKNDSNEIFRAAIKAEKASERLHEKYLQYEKEQETSNKKEINLENSKTQVNKIYAYVLEGENGKGKESGLIGEAELNKKGIENIYEISKNLYKNRIASKIKIFGVSSDGIFYHSRPDKSNFELSKQEYASNLLTYTKKTLDNENLKYRIEDMKIIDKQYNVGILELFKELNKNINFNEKEKNSDISENIKSFMKENPYISKKELVEKTGIDEKQLNEEIGKLIKDKEIFYLGNKENIKYYTDKTEYIKELQKQETEKEAIKEERKKEIESLVKEAIKKEIPKDNYNALTGNQIITENHLSGDKRWIAMSDIKDNNISVKDNQKPTLTIVLHKENGKLHASPIEYYNVSQLEITKEVEQKFVPMKEKEKNIEKSKDRGIER